MLASDGAPYPHSPPAPPLDSSLGRRRRARGAGEGEAAGEMLTESEGGSVGISSGTAGAAAFFSG